MTRDADLHLSLCPMLPKLNQLSPTSSTTDDDQFQVYCSYNPTHISTYSKLAIFTIEFGEPVVIYNKPI